MKSTIDPDTAPRLPVYYGRSGLAPGIEPLSNRSMLDAADDD
jgi:hypothetical protein